MKLTKVAIDKIVYSKVGNKQDIRWDDGFPNFGIRVYPSGKKSFMLSYRRSGRKRIMVLGQYGPITIAQARELARKELARMSLDLEYNPLEQRNQSRTGKSLKELCSDYLENYAKVHKKSWKDDERRINSRIIPAWGGRNVESIVQKEITGFHRKVGQQHPYEANRLVELLAKMFDLGKEWGYVKRDHVNPARGIKSFKEEKRDRWVTQDELPQLVAAIDAEPNTYARDALWLYLLTGLRKRELLQAKWSDVDFERCELCLIDTKNGRKHYVPLSTTALAVLNRIPREKDNSYIIVGKLPGSHLVNIDKAWRRVRSAAGVMDVRLHDLRRTVGSWLAQSGNSLHLIGKVLGHLDSKSTEVYARFGQDHVRQALEDHGNMIKKVAGGGGQIS